MKEKTSTEWYLDPKRRIQVKVGEIIKRGDRWVYLDSVWLRPAGDIIGQPLSHDSSMPLYRRKEIKWFNNPKRRVEVKVGEIIHPGDVWVDEHYGNGCPDFINAGSPLLANNGTTLYRLKTKAARSSGNWWQDPSARVRVRRKGIIHEGDVWHDGTACTQWIGRLHDGCDTMYRRRVAKTPSVDNRVNALGILRDLLSELGNLSRRVSETLEAINRLI